MNMIDKQWQIDLSRVLGNLTVNFGKDLSWKPSRAIWPHLHTFYQLDYFYNGFGTVLIAGKEYSVKPRDLFITNPGEEHAFEAATKQPMEGLVLKFDLAGEFPKPTFPNYIGNLARLSRNQQWELEGHLRRACFEMNKGGQEGALLATSFLVVFFGLLSQYLQDVEHLLNSNSMLNQSDSVLEYIRRHYDRHITLSDLARVAQLDPEYLCHKFSREIGMSPMAALTKERMEAAKQLLTNTRLSVAEVGMRVGYPDAYHFSRRFKEIVGKSPKQYRLELEQVPTDIPPPP